VELSPFSSGRRRLQVFLSSVHVFPLVGVPLLSVWDRKTSRRFNPFFFPTAPFPRESQAREKLVPPRKRQPRSFVLPLLVERRPPILSIPGRSTSLGVGLKPLGTFPRDPDKAFRAEVSLTSSLRVIDPDRGSRPKSPVFHTICRCPCVFGWYGIH